MNVKPLAVVFSILLFISLSIFTGLVVLVMINPDSGSWETAVEFLRDNVVGNIIILIPGLFSILYLGILVALYFHGQKQKDLRYKMAFYLYHSKVQKDDVIPLDHLARVAVCTIKDIERTLGNMIAKNELMGLIDNEKKVYIHKGLTKRTMRILTALPPARKQQLDSVKRWALKGAEAYEDMLEELEPVEIEELPSVTDEINSNKVERNVPCPSCGKMNSRRDHFCTYCGEVID